MPGTKFSNWSERERERKRKREGGREREKVSNSVNIGIPSQSDFLQSKLIPFIIFVLLLVFLANKYRDDIEFINFDREGQGRIVDRLAAAGTFNKAIANLVGRIEQSGRREKRPLSRRATFRFSISVILNRRSHPPMPPCLILPSITRHKGICSNSLAQLLTLIIMLGLKEKVGTMSNKLSVPADR